MIMENFEIQRDIMKTTFNSVKEQRDKVMQQLKTRFDYLFDLKPIFGLYRQYAKKSINKKELQEQIEKIVKTEERTDTYREMIHIFKMKDKTCPVISKSGLNDGISQVKEQLKILYQIYKSGQWIFVVPKLGNSNNNLRILSYGKVFQFNNQDPQ